MTEFDKHEYYNRRALGDIWKRYDELAIKHGKSLQVWAETVSHLHQLQETVSKLEKDNRQKEAFIKELKVKVEDYETVMFGTEYSGKGND